jgi:hypothetical protein
MNIYEKVNEVRKKIDYIRKEKAVQNYKAVTHDQVTALIRQHLVDIGIVIIPDLVSTVTEDTGEKTSKGTPIIRVEAVYSFEFVNIEDAADKFITKVSAHANDTGDKAPGKALSYAKKALVLKVFEIETGEDEESRYQTADFNLEMYLDILKGAENLDDLRKLFADAMGAVNEAKDKEAAKTIIKAKDSRKAELQKAAA